MVAGTGTAYKYKSLTVPAFIDSGDAEFEAISVSVPPVVLTYISAYNSGVPPFELIEAYCSKFQLPEGIVVTFGSLDTVANEPISCAPAPVAVNVVPVLITKFLSKT